MHLYILTRGHEDHVKMFVRDMLSSAMYMPYPNIAGVGTTSLVQTAMRPIQLWEVVFPKDSLQTVMNSIWDVDPAPDNFAISMMSAGLRKVLGAEKIPPLDKTVQGKMVYKHNIGILPIGVKEDGDWPGAEKL